MRVFDFDRAIVREPAQSVVQGLRTGSEAPRHDRILAEHRAYVAALEAAGVIVETLPALSEHPDSVFVEDPAFVVPEGARRFCALAGDLGRRARIVEPPAGLLHFKTGCALIDERTLIAVPAMAPLFPGYEMLTTPRGEEHSANLIRINDRILMGAGFPKTAAMLSERGLDVAQTPASEIARIDAGLSCMSLRWHSGAPFSR